MASYYVLLFIAAVLAASGARGDDNGIYVYPDRAPTSVPIEHTTNMGFSIPESFAHAEDDSFGLEPEQIHLTYWGTPSKMLVSFASGDGHIILGHPTALPWSSVDAAVEYGTDPKAFSHTAPCLTTSYVQDQFDWQKSPSYVSPYISHCLMMDLPPGKTVYYRVGWPELKQWSQLHNFTTFKESSNFPFSVAVMADLGTSFNATTTVQQVVQSKPQVVLNVGDFSYADIYLPTSGRQGYVKGYKNSLTYQPRWDMYGRMLQPLTAYVPMMTSTGNHDIEFQPDGTVFAAYNTRYPVPMDVNRGPEEMRNKFSIYNPSPDKGLYYSWEVPGTARFIALTSYITNDTFTTESAQYKWLEDNLKTYDRSKTPWLVVYFHAPMVSSYADSFKQVECMRLTYEPLLYKYGVDFIMNGHVHAYERSKPVYNYTLDRCGPIHITVGCSGKPGIATGEYALDYSFIEAQPQPKWCANPQLLKKAWNPAQPYLCFSEQPELGGFCWNKQPDFSAYREPAYGHGMLELLNATHAEWKWYRNKDDLEKHADFFILKRDPSNRCPNRQVPGSAAAAAVRKAKESAEVAGDASQDAGSLSNEASTGKPEGPGRRLMGAASAGGMSPWRSWLCGNSTA